MKEEKSIIPTFVTLTHVNGQKVSIREDHLLAARSTSADNHGTHVFIARDQNHEMLPVREDVRTIPGPLADFNLSDSRVLRINIHFIAAIGYDQKHNCVAVIDTNGKEGSWHINDSHDTALRAVKNAWEKLAP